MLDINLIRKDKKLVAKALQDRNMKFDIYKLLDLDLEKRKMQLKVDELRAKQNKTSDEIAKLEGAEKQQAILDVKGTAERLKDLEEKNSKLEKEFKNQMDGLPNIPAPDVKVGKSEEDNEVIKTEGTPTKFDFKPKDHMALGQTLDLIDTKRAAKVSGTRFNYLKNELVLLEFALIRFAMDELTKAGLHPIIPPVIISEKAMAGMGFLNQVDGREIYQTTDPDDPKKKQYLVGTSEQSIGPMHMDEIFAQKDLPKRYAGFSTCFRRESGSYGKDTHGILRVHQFDKIEMFTFCTPDQAETEYNLLLSLHEKLFKTLGIPYRLVRLCTADLGFSKARTIDLEAWIPSQNKYREEGSCSTCTNYQARRLNTKFRNVATNKNEFVYTLNATAFGMPRTLIAIMENYQQKDGSIKIPEVLWDYCGIKEIKR